MLRKELKRTIEQATPTGLGPGRVGRAQLPISGLWRRGPSEWQRLTRQQLKAEGPAKHLRLLHDKLRPEWQEGACPMRTRERWLPGWGNICNLPGSVRLGEQREACVSRSIMGERKRGNPWDLRGGKGSDHTGLFKPGWGCGLHSKCTGPLWRVLWRGMTCVDCNTSLGGLYREWILREAVAGVQLRDNGGLDRAVADVERSEWAGDRVSGRVRRRTCKRKREVNDNSCISDLNNWWLMSLFIKWKAGVEVEGHQEFWIYWFWDSYQAGSPWLECHQTIAKARHLNEISSGECLIERIKRHRGVAWASTDLEVGEIRRNCKTSERKEFWEGAASEVKQWFSKYGPGTSGHSIT